MSPKLRVGHVMRGIRRAFIVEPSRALSTSELAKWTHSRPIRRGRLHSASGTTIGGQSGASVSGCVCALVGLRAAADGRSCGAHATARKPSMSRVVALQIGLDTEEEM